MARILHFSATVVSATVSDYHTAKNYFTAHYNKSKDKLGSGGQADIYGAYCLNFYSLDVSTLV